MSRPTLWLLPRKIRPDHRRLKFLDAQLTKDRQEQLVLQARQSTTAGNLQQAQDLLQQAQQVESKSAEITSAQQAIDSRTRTQQVTQLLDLARQRVAQNRLVAPPARQRQVLPAQRGADGT